jgi:hypothetical protein
MTYTHLTQAGRYQIEILRKANHKQSEIAVLLGRDKSCISPEGMIARAFTALPFAILLGTHVPWWHVMPHTQNF